MFQYRKKVTPFAASEVDVEGLSEYEFQYRKKVTPFAAFAADITDPDIMLFQYRKKVTPFAAPNGRFGSFVAV